ncbi:hypothetical protein Tco_0191657 [Tanacetum coccineum]
MHEKKRQDPKVLRGIAGYGGRSAPHGRATAAAAAGKAAAVVVVPAVAATEDGGEDGDVDVGCDVACRCGRRQVAEK